MLRVILIFLTSQLAIRKTAGNTIWLENVHCDTYVDYIETDPIHARYLPYVVRLHRCQGSVGAIKPSVKACVPRNVSELEIVTQNLQTFRYETIRVLNHTSCMSRCTSGASSCNQYQKWDPKRCRCNCKTRGEPKKDTCCAPKKWSDAHCGCICAQPKPEKCHKRKEWNNDECSCQCRQKFHHKCAQANATIDLDTCRCISMVSHEPVILPCYDDGTRLSMDIVVLVCVAEALLMAFGYIVYYVACTHAKEKNSETSILLSPKINKKEKKRRNVTEIEELQSESAILTSTS